MKPKIKEILFGAFAVVCLPVGFALHSWQSLCFLILGSICGAFALYFTLLNHRSLGITEPQARNWGLLFFGLFSIGSGLYWRECKQLPIPEPKPYPHFQFSILKQERTLEDSLPLTNDFLIITPGPVSIGNILFPVTSQSDFVFRLSVQNMGPPMSENAWINISLPKELLCDPNPQWEDDERGQFSSLTFRPPNLLSGDSWELPDIRFRHIPFSPPDGNLQPLYCTILARAKDSPAEMVMFNFVFVSVSTNVSLKPIILPSKNIGEGKSVFFIPPEIKKDMKR